MSNHTKPDKYFKQPYIDSSQVLPINKFIPNLEKDF